MMELVLTKQDVTHLSIVDDATIVDNGHNPKKAYTLTNLEELDAPGVCRILAAIGVLNNYDSDDGLSYVSYVEGGALYTISNKQGITVAELKRNLERIIKETTKPLDVLSININKEDCEMVKLPNGNPLWERESVLLGKLGFTLTTESGRTYVAKVPEYLRMPLAQTYLGVISLAGAAIAIQKLVKYPENAIVDSVRFDLPGTEMDDVSLLPDWFYIGVHHPVRVRELMWFLDGYLRMFTPHAVSTAEIEQETKIKDTLEKLLEDWK